jgi:hypothetical protein
MSEQQSSWVRFILTVIAGLSTAAALYQPLVDFLHFPVSVSVRLDEYRETLTKLADRLERAAEASIEARADCSGVKDRLHRLEDEVSRRHGN